MSVDYARKILFGFDIIFLLIGDRQLNNNLLGYYGSDYGLEKDDVWVDV
jgi:hypothetical protein